MKLCKISSLLVLLFALQAKANTLLGTVINVADGDTITVLDDTYTQHKIRLAGIDAPEKRQAFGNVSKRSLAEQVSGRTALVEWSKIDKYGRKVGRVLMANKDINLEQVRRGLAWHYKQYEREQSMGDRKLYEAAEDAARAERVGLWQDAAPIPPWTFRRPQMIQ